MKEYDLTDRTTENGWEVLCPDCQHWHSIGIVHVDGRADNCSCWMWGHNLEEGTFSRVTVPMNEVGYAFENDRISILKEEPTFGGAIKVQIGDYFYIY